MHHRLIAASICLILATPTTAQLPNLSSLSGVLGGASSVGRSNAAGLLSYCVQRKLLGAAGAQGVLGKLTGAPEVAGSKEYQAGQTGQLLTGKGQQFSLDGVRDQVKGRVCSLVLDRAQGFVAR